MKFPLLFGAVEWEVSVQHKHSDYTVNVMAGGVYLI
jgi:hypothetical protein